MDLIRSDLCWFSRTPIACEVGATVVYILEYEERHWSGMYSPKKKDVVTGTTSGFLTINPSSPGKQVMHVFRIKLDEPLKSIQHSPRECTSELVYHILLGDSPAEQQLSVHMLLAYLRVQQQGVSAQVLQSACMDAVNKIVESGPDTERLLRCLTFVGEQRLKITDHVDFWSAWTKALIRTPPPGQPLNEAAVVALSKLANQNGVQISSDYTRTQRSGEAGELTWMGCILWGLAPQHLLQPLPTAYRRPKRERDIGHYRDGLKGLHHSIATESWDLHDLHKLFKKLLDDVPMSQSSVPEAVLLELLKQEWRFHTANGADAKYSILDICQRTAVPFDQRRCIALSIDVKDALWTLISGDRCQLDRLVDVFDNVTIDSVQSAVRRKASRCSEWEWEANVQGLSLGFSPEQILGIIKRLEFRRDRNMSEELIRSFVGHVSPPFLDIYPYLLELLQLDPNLHKDRLDQGSVDTNVTRIWVERMLQDMTPVEGVVRLFEHLEQHWAAWNSDELGLREPLLSMEAQMTKLHKRPGLNGGESLLQAARLIGMRLSLAASPAVEDWLMPSVKGFLSEWVDDQHQGGQRAARAVEILTTTPSRGGVVVPHALSEVLLSFILAKIGENLPRVKLINHLLREDQCQLWCALLRVECDEAALGFAMGVFDLPMQETLVMVSTTIRHFCYSLDTATVFVATSLEILNETKRNKHATIHAYLDTLDFPVQRADEILEAIEALLQTHEELAQFLLRCQAASDHSQFMERLQTIRQLHELQLMNTGYRPRQASQPTPPDIEKQHAYFGVLAQHLDVARTFFRLRNSQLFAHEWDKAEKAYTEEAGEGGVTMQALSTVVYKIAKSEFLLKCTALIDNDEITIGEIRHILGNHLQRELLQQELELLFPDRPPATVQTLHERLVWFTSFEATLRDSIAIDGLITNLCSKDTTERTPGGQSPLVASSQAVNDLAKVDATVMADFARASAHFYEMLRPFDEMREMAPALAEPRAGELIDFLQTVTDLRSLVDAQDSKDMAGTINALMKIREILKPILPDETSATDLARDLPDAFEKLTAAVRIHHTSGAEAAILLTECCSNLDGLRNAWLGSTDKSGQSKKKTSKIVAHGEWIFEALGDHVTLPDGTIMQHGQGQFVVVCPKSSLCARMCPPPIYGDDIYGDDEMFPYRILLEAVGADLNGVTLGPILDSLFISNQARSDVSFDYRVELSRDDGDLDKPLPYELYDVLSSTELDDLRSRALLIINSEMESTDQEELEHRKELTTFLSLAEKADSIGMWISELIELGHFEAQRFGVDETQRVAGNEAALTMRHDELSWECNQWRDELKAVRIEHYLASFFCSSQLWQLWQLLCSDEDVPSSFSDLLRYIPTQQPPLLCRSSRNHVPGEAPNLRSLALALNMQFEGAAAHQRVPPEWKEGSQLVNPNSKVAAGEIVLSFVKPLKETSNILETCLALYAADGCLPEHHQLLFCNELTSKEDIDIFLHRAFNVHELTGGRLFCVLRVSRLPEMSYLHLIDELTHRFKG